MNVFDYRLGQWEKAGSILLKQLETAESKVEKLESIIDELRTLPLDNYTAAYDLAADIRAIINGPTNEPKQEKIK